MVQALRVEGKERVMLSILFLSSLAFDVVLGMITLGIVCRKVYTFSFVLTPFHTDITDCCIVVMSFKVLQVLDKNAASVAPLRQQGPQRKEPTDLDKLRHKFLVMILTIESLAGGAVLGIIGVFLIDFLRRRTWIFVAFAICLAALVEHVMLLLTPSIAKTKKSRAKPTKSSSGAADLSSASSTYCGC
jgi:hypothetical protein